MKYDRQTDCVIDQSQPMIINCVQPGNRNQISIGERLKTSQEAQLCKVALEMAELAM